MKFIAKLIASLLLIYSLCWVGVAVYFNYAERHKAYLEDRLSRVFDREVTIDRLQTTWVGWSPALRIQGFQVSGEPGLAPVLSFESASMVISPSSILRFWPQLTEFAVEKPSIEIESLANNQLQIAGIKLVSNKRPRIDRKTILSWLLDQTNTALHAGEIRWRKLDGDVKRYSDISFIYSRQAQSRLARATVNSSNGRLVVTGAANGDMMRSNDWDASLEVVGGVGEALLEPSDLSFNVKDGQGRIQLARLDVERVRDFLALSGLADKARWILDAELSGLLHDVKFEFSGALAALSNWSLQASATDVDFKSLNSIPALTNLNGGLLANAQGGSFDFTAVNSVFEWSRWYEQSFPIKSAEGHFRWVRDPSGGIDLSLERGSLKDENLHISDINANIIVAQRLEKVSSFAQLFKLDSVEDLSYRDGEVVLEQSAQSRKPVIMDAGASFDVPDVSVLYQYLPNAKKLEKFRNWLQQGFQAGALTDGQASYRGEISPRAFREDRARLRVSADFDSALIDYAPNDDWPPAERGRGEILLENDLLTISPSELWLNGDPVTDAGLTIERLYSREALLSLNGKTTTSLAKGMAFIFQGPLIKKEKRPETLPVEPISGWVDINVALTMPLTHIKDLTVSGTSTLKDGLVMLPEGVPISGVNGVVKFTERRVESDRLEAFFLGGQTHATLTTTEETLPPKMRVSATGVAKVAELQPWVGEHLLTIFHGEAAWQGALDVNGDNISLSGISNLEGVDVTAPAPLMKAANEAGRFAFLMNLGGETLEGQTPAQSLVVEYNDVLKAEFLANLALSDTDSSVPKQPSLFDNALLQIGRLTEQELQPGINIAIDSPNLDVDSVLDSVIDLASYEPVEQTQNTDFLDAMRSVSISSDSATLLGRDFGVFNVMANTADGFSWAGDIMGDDIRGRLNMQPRDDVGKYGFELEYLSLDEEIPSDVPLDPIDYSLEPTDYPELSIDVERFRSAGKNLGALSLRASPDGDRWVVNRLNIVHNGIRTVATGHWLNTDEQGSLSEINFETVIDEAEGALTEMDFDGVIRRGQGTVKGQLSWLGAPHEFDYSRLNGDFDMRLTDGELVQVEPGSGKLLGLLNFNAILRRLVFDFRDVFASGLKFDRMQYSGLLADGEAILQEAYIFTPAVFVRMEGKIDLAKELVDLEVHMSPELGGNLTLLSALANPAAGAVVFLTSQIFKEDMRKSSFKSYRALGTWEDFEMVEIGKQGEEIRVDPVPITAPRSEAEPLN